MEKKYKYCVSTWYLFKKRCTGIYREKRFLSVDKESVFLYTLKIECFDNQTNWRDK